ncbi:MAG: 50S ribosomal protein L23 [Deltaproteobacteria bacterium RBG_13_58_19]|nr:MAG: 50S ribosomal protein L23 [Deltaproteobacteria bacterium RBG_13_58_19]
MKPHYQLLKGPIITEKTHMLKEQANKVTFKVDVKANKIEIRKAVEELFKVKVLAVNTIRLQGKKKRVGRTEGVRPQWKKAIVTLAPGEKISGIEGL